jgi:general nucleoside transport system permease protein
VSGRLRLGALALTLAAPALAVAVALLMSTVTLVVAGNPPLETFRSMLDYGVQPRSMALTLNTGTYYYLSALAVAIGFRMNMFNIGVDGQYRLAAFCAAAVGGAVTLPGPLRILLVLVVAVLVGALWAGIAGVLKATRGVSEVISTIMLNAIATGLVAYLLTEYGTLEGNDISTTPLPESAHFPSLPFPGTSQTVYGFVVVAALAGVGYAVLLNRTRFGFDLRATGISETAAVASGVDVRRMVVVAMLLSGGMAGLVGMPILLGAAYSYGVDFPAGIGFTGIAIALVGRNSPVGIALGALLFAFLDQSSQILDLEGIAREIVLIMQGTIVLSVVVAYELVRRYRLVQEQRQVGRALAGDERAGRPEGAPA